MAVAESRGRPTSADLRTLWKRRKGNTPSPLLLLVCYLSSGATKVAISGPVGDPPAVFYDQEPDVAQRIAQAALTEPNRHAAVRFLVAALGELESELPGLRNEGLLAAHELRSGVPKRQDWLSACESGRSLLGKRGRELVEALGFAVQARDSTTFTLRAGAQGTATAVAIFLDETEAFESAGSRFDGNSPVSLALAKADADRLPFVVITRGPQIRLYAADKHIVGVGRKGRSETYIEANLVLLPPEATGYLPLLFGASALLPDGSFEAILERCKNYSAELSKRLRERIYGDVVPLLATAIARRAARRNALTEDDLRFIYEQCLFILFRLVFIAYAEDRGLLPFASNANYRAHALKTTAQRLAERQNEEGEPLFDVHATDLWTGVQQLFRAVDRGNSEWAVPAYDGGLFSARPEVSPVGAAIEDLQLSNEEFGPPLTGLLVELADEGTYGAIDFRSLSVREFGTIYEGLLESNLSLAQSDLALDKAGAYVPAGEDDAVAVPAGEAYLHNRSGARKASGSYFTKEFAVEHLLDHALEPALDDHLERLSKRLETGDEAGAAEAFFDFRVADIAMGSGHFLVNAVDHIEARLTSFLTEHPLPAVNAELAALQRSALERLGDGAEEVEIEQAALVRRQVARRCIYGVDLNPIAVELARLALWIHTFVSGLPLSFLDRTLVCGNSLTGIGTLDEAVEAVEGRQDAARGTLSLARIIIEKSLDKARAPLRRLGRISDATPQDIEEARQAQADAQRAVEPAATLFDLAVAARLGAIDPLTDISERDLESTPGRQRAGELAKRLGSLHFPVAFPEVFTREHPGFDCIVGNPPWEEVTVETRRFWTQYSPGLHSKSQPEQQRLVQSFELSRPDLVREFQQLVEKKEDERRVLLAGQFPGMEKGDADLYKAFCWRFWQLCRQEGQMGLLMPRSALMSAGSQPWRESVLTHGTFSNVTLLVNSRQWVFEDIHPQYTVALVSVAKEPSEQRAVSLMGPFASLAALEAGGRTAPLVATRTAFEGWSETHAFPLIPRPDAATVFTTMRKSPSLCELPWGIRPVRELDATNDKKHMLMNPASTDGLWPVYKGESFTLWLPDTGTYYGWADPKYITDFLFNKRLNQSRLARSAFSGFPREWVSDRSTLPCLAPRIAYRQVARATDSRTLYTTLVPPNVLLANHAPYLLWQTHTPCDEAFLLGVLSSLPLDWYVRRWVEINMSFYVVNALPIPVPEARSGLRREVELLAGRLTSVDNRYEAWAMSVGVEVAGVSPDEREDLVTRLDAAVALLFGLDEKAVEVLFETFHVGWNYGPRLDAVLAHYSRLRALT